MSQATLLSLAADDLARGRPYAERDEREPRWHDRAALWLWHGLVRPALHPLVPETLQRRAFVARVQSHAGALAQEGDEALRTRALVLRRRLRAEGFQAAPVAELFAVIDEAAARVLGQRYYPVQLWAGWQLLRGTLVEMATGEGKTFAATLPAVTAALSGLPVHVVTVNDYLAARDAETMGPLYAFFGLRCAAIVHGLAREQRRVIYAGHVAYASNKELAFDYLRDRAALGDRASPLHLACDGLRERRHAAAGCVLRGLAFAIVDEADSVFIDEARTPLILSGMTAAAGQGQERYATAVAWARELHEGPDFELDRTLRRVRLTDAGRDAVDALVEADPEAHFEGPRAAQQAVERALSALHLYALDQHYVVVEGKVQIVDESTGRTMADRAWEHGLHQMVEAKEGVAVTGERQTMARLTYQRLFRRYLRLAGMSGTAAEVASEIGRTYGLPVVRVPLHRTLRRRVRAPRCLRDGPAKWAAVADAVEQAARSQGRPVLIGTRTVKASEELAAMLSARGIDHVVLNAKQDREEAAIVERAGEAARVTVATNMAGRGTDIKLAPGVAERGGLHVILTEYHESRRIDRQLFGRSARQGDPGSAQAIVALDDELFTTHAPALTAWMAGSGFGRTRAGLALLRWWAQAAAERRNRESRESALKQDRRYARLLAFSGRGE